MNPLLTHWIWFSELPGLSQRQKLNLLRQGFEPEELYHTGTAEIEQIPDAAPLADKDLTHAREIAQQCREKGIGILTFRDAAFPSRLRNVDDGPVLLYYRGNLPDLDAQPVIALVGTRKATPYGLRIARSMAGQIAACGGLVVSGGAFGVDAAAMESALDAGFFTVGVLGCGVDVVYPVSNRNLFERVVAKGCLISEYPPGTKPEYWHFPQRNRIISGISHGVLIVEAPRKSGALITARCALEQGRDVFVVPGNIDSAACEGSNSLLMEGAQPVMHGWNLMETYAHQYPDTVSQRDVRITPEKETPTAPCDKINIDNPAVPPYSGMMDRLSDLSEEEKTLVSCLTVEPMLIDTLIDRTGIPAAKVLSMLTMLSLKGYVTMHPGRRVSAKID